MRWLLILPLAGVGLCVLAEHMLAGEAGHAAWLRVQIELSKGLSLTGALVAAFTFARGEYLRRAWLFTGGCMAVLLLRDATLLIEDGQALTVVRGVMVVLANLSAVIGAWMLARAWKVAGIALPGGRTAQLAVLGLAVVVALALGGPGVVDQAGKLFAGDFDALVWIGSGLGDIVSLILIAPVLLTALALRGGRLGWPWGLLTASMLSWLLYDACLMCLPLVGADEVAAKTASEVFRCLAGLLGLAAGLAQNRVVALVRRGA